jgi:type VI secretion system protein ImpK
MTSSPSPAATAVAVAGAGGHSLRAFETFPHGRLAQAFQEPFTVAVRLRAGHPVASSSDDFRQRIRPLLAEADRAARGAGYDPSDVRSAMYAFVAFLDESVLNATQPMFADWSRLPLQEEFFGEHMAGEVFFRNLQELATRPDARALADLLEVHLLCLALGFRGRYSTNPEALDAMVERLRARVEGIRGGRPPLAPDAGLPAGEAPPPHHDPWIRRLVLTLAGVAGVVLILGVLFHLGLSSGVVEVAERARELTR